MFLYKNVCIFTTLLDGSSIKMWFMKSSVHKESLFCLLIKPIIGLKANSCYLVGSKLLLRISSVIWQKGETQNAYQGVKNLRFSENLACFVFLLPLF